ncbi:MAG: chemotaxis protein CheA [Pirellula sp.]|nr:chemotaxis protein CheA [Pirellula sp.]
MTNDPGESGLHFEQFLDDFYVECDEHLSVARRAVLALEASLQQEVIDRGLLDELFRSFHSIKGLSAMVGLQVAEQLAHGLESYLGLLRKAQTKLTSEGLEALVAGVIAIEQVVAAKRDGAPKPDVTELTKRLEALLPSTAVNEAVPKSSAQGAPSGSTSTDVAAKVAMKLVDGGRAWSVHFAPSPAGSELGINVNSVRAELLQLGTLVHSEPRIEAGGRVAFLFLLITPGQDPPQFTMKEGLTVTPYEPASPVVESDAAPSATTDSESGAARGGGSTHLVPANLVRVDLGRLDELMRMVGELVLSRARLQDALQRLHDIIPSAERRTLEEVNLVIERQLRDLREGVMRIRMVPVHEVFARMQFVIRDLVREQGKRAALHLSGEETQIDKFIVERMMDPLLHLIRNAVSHGLESPEERIAAGKSPEARIDLRAATIGDTIVVEVEDDGRGIDAAKVLARAEAMGMAPRSTNDPAALLDILCAPGFSTREEADRSSGRGVGMDVVRRAVEELGGALIVHTKLGFGTRFVIHLPLTLAITDALIVSVHGERYAVPQVAVREVIQIESTSITTIENNELLTHHGRALPLLRLDRFFGARNRQAIAAHHVLVVGDGSDALGLVVERILGLREVVVRPLTDRLVQVPGISGATELGDGQVVLILDVADLKRNSRNRKLASTGERYAGGRHDAANQVKQTGAKP